MIVTGWPQEKKLKILPGATQWMNCATCEFCESNADKYTYRCDWLGVGFEGWPRDNVCASWKEIEC